MRKGGYSTALVGVNKDMLEKQNQNYMSQQTKALATISKTPALIGRYMVKLSNAGNPDHRQDPDRTLPGTRNGWAPASSLAECVDICARYMTHYDLGSGNWTGGAIKDGTGKVVARVSANGRVWEGAKYGGKEISINGEKTAAQHEAEGWKDFLPCAS